MNKCVRISFSCQKLPKDFLREVLLKKARLLEIEGTAQMSVADGRVKIVACGSKDNIDEFMDFLHKGPGKTVLDDIEAEPFLKDKEYRGVFRVIE